MLTLYTWKTPNGYKVPILLEELDLEYDLTLVDITVGEQKTPEYLAINPNNKIPALVDHDVPGGPLTVFESGAILMYLAERAGKLFPQDARAKSLVTEWVLFQAGGVGPMFGQAGHFIKFAKEKVPYAIERYTTEAVRLCAVMEKRLTDAPYFAGDYSIGDIMAWPWVRSGIDAGYIEIDKYPSLKRWYSEVGERPAVKRGLQRVDDAVAARKRR